MRDIASAYGYTANQGRRTRAEKLYDGAGLVICKPTETLARAGKAIATGSDGRPKDPQLWDWWGTLSDADRQRLIEWDSGQFGQRGRAVPYRVRQFKRWTRAAGVEHAPNVGPRPGPLLALSMARAAGMPSLLEEWLLCVALQDASRWRLVALSMETVGHEAWAAEEAGYAIVYGNQGRLRDRAKRYGVRAAVYAEKVGEAREVLLRWLDKAAEWLLESVSARDGDSMRTIYGQGRDGMQSDQSDGNPTVPTQAAA
ncbi:hypothetical protein [Thermomonas sp.]|uniref:hypothetical protein n=1 Tax=Thermomonas sp. TaxID=1971895 RepID=UPI0035AFE01C